MKKEWIVLQSSDEIRKRLMVLERAGLTDDAYADTDILYADGHDDINDGIIIEAEMDHLGLSFRNNCWEDEQTDAYWLSDANRQAERVFQLG